MRRNYLRMYVCAVVVCICVLAGCSGKSGDTADLLEAEEISEDTVQGGPQESPPADGASENADGESIYVHVCGQVQCPGVYELAGDSRLYEAIQAAGGMTEDAADTYLNQAEVLVDGQQVYVPSGEEVQTSTAISPPQEAEDGRVNINTASREELMTLTGIGEAKAGAIIRYREDKGSFQSTEELKEVEGIKDGVYNKVKDQIKV